MVRRPIRLPKIRPLLPRISSAASGLRFCGMIELPLEKSSAMRTKPNCGVDHKTSSSPRRDRWTAAIAAAARNSSAKSRSDTASIEFAIGWVKPSSAAVIARSIGKLVPARAAAPSGHSFNRARPSRSRPRSRPNIST